MKLKKFSAAALAALTVTMMSAAPVLAADDIEVNEDISVSGDYDWKRFANDHITLNVYNNGLYISDGSDESVNVLSAFEELTGIKVNYTTYDSNESLYAKLKSGGVSYDVIFPSDYMVGKMAKEGMLSELNMDNIPNFAGIGETYLDRSFDPGNKYSVPYMWGTAGILFNKKFITAEEAGTWDILWDSKNRGKILMKDSYRDAYGTAIIYAHARELADSTVTVEQLMNDNSPQAIALAEQRLKEMKPNIAGWEADFGKEMMTKNKAWINFTWSGDAVWAIEEADAVGVELDYTVPCEGSNIWYDGWVIPRYARNVKAASYFINYLCQPSVALRNMDAIGYVSAVATPEIMEAKTDTTLDVHSDLSYFFGPLPGADSLQIDPVQYPDRRVVERCAMIRDFGDRTELVLEMWSRVKGDNLNTGIVLLIFAVFGLLFIWLVYAKIRKYKQKRRHRLRRKRKRG